MIGRKGVGALAVVLPVLLAVVLPRTAEGGDAKVGVRLHALNSTARLFRAVEGPVPRDGGEVGVLSHASDAVSAARAVLHHHKCTEECYRFGALLPDGEVVSLGTARAPWSPPPTACHGAPPRDESRGHHHHHHHGHPTPLRDVLRALAVPETATTIFSLAPRPCGVPPTQADWWGGETLCLSLIPLKGGEATHLELPSNSSAPPLLPLRRKVHAQQLQPTFVPLEERAGGCDAGRAVQTYEECVAAGPGGAVEGVWGDHPQGCYKKGDQIFWNPTGKGTPSAERVALCRTTDPPVQPSNTRCMRPKANATSVQRVGPCESTYNVVFVSGGYTSSQQQLFYDDVQSAVNILQSPPVDAMKATVPYTRYFPLLNIHAVFEPSDVAGAYTGNNLECSMLSVGQAIACDTMLAVELASCSSCGASGKANVVTVVFVNDDRYGGVASRLDYELTKVATFSVRWWSAHPREKQQFASLFIHEMAHAWFNLADEYDVAARTGGGGGGFQQSLVVNPNCNWDHQNPPWKAWTQETSEYTKISPVAVPPCGDGANDGKPSTYCLMEALNSERFCPICREKGVTEMYKLGGPRPTEVRQGVPPKVMSITDSQCPVRGSTVMISRRAGRVPSRVVLYGNKRFLSSPEVEVRWTADPVPPNWKDVTQSTFLEVDANALDLVEGKTYTFRLHVRDATSWLKRDQKLMEWWEEAERNYPALRGLTSGCDSNQECDYPTLYNNTDIDTWTVQTVDFTVLVEGDGSSSDPGVQEALLSQPMSISLYEAYQFDLQESHPTEMYVVACSNPHAFGCDCNQFLHAPYEIKHDYGSHVEIVKEKASMALMITLPATLLVGYGVEYLAKRKGLKSNTPPTFMRRLLVGSSALLCLSSFTTAAVCAFIYHRVEPFRGLFFVFLFSVAYYLLFAAWIGLVAAWHYTRVMVRAYAASLLLVLFPLAVLIIFAVWYRASSPGDGSTLQDQAESMWKDMGSDKMCAVQRHFECSGWEANCWWASGRADCPQHCEDTNLRFREPCSSRIKEDYDAIFPVLLLLLLLYFVYLAASIVVAAKVSREPVPSKDPSQGELTLSTGQEDAVTDPLRPRVWGVVDACFTAVTVALLAAALFSEWEGGQSLGEIHNNGFISAFGAQAALGTLLVLYLGVGFLTARLWRAWYYSWGMMKPAREMLYPVALVAVLVIVTSSVVSADIHSEGGCAEASCDLSAGLVLALMAGSLAQVHFGVHCAQDVTGKKALPLDPPRNVTRVVTMERSDRLGVRVSSNTMQLTQVTEDTPASAAGVGELMGWTLTHVNSYPVFTPEEAGEEGKDMRLAPTTTALRFQIFRRPLLWGVVEVLAGVAVIGCAAGALAMPWVETPKGFSVSLGDLRDGKCLPIAETIAPPTLPGPGLGGPGPNPNRNKVDTSLPPDCDKYTMALFGFIGLVLLVVQYLAALGGAVVVMAMPRQYGARWWQLASDYVIPWCLFPCALVLMGAISVIPDVHTALARYCHSNDEACDDSIGMGARMAVAAVAVAFITYWVHRWQDATTALPVGEKDLTRRRKAFERSYKAREAVLLENTLTDDQLKRIERAFPGPVTRDTFRSFWVGMFGQEVTPGEVTWAFDTFTNGDAVMTWEEFYQLITQSSLTFRAGPSGSLFVRSVIPIEGSATEVTSVSPPPSPSGPPPDPLSHGLTMATATTSSGRSQHSTPPPPKDPTPYLPPEPPPSPHRGVVKSYSLDFLLDSRDDRSSTMPIRSAPPEPADFVDSILQNSSTTPEDNPLQRGHRRPPPPSRKRSRREAPRPPRRRPSIQQETSDEGDIRFDLPSVNKWSIPRQRHHSTESSSTSSRHITSGRPQSTREYKGRSPPLWSDRRRQVSPRGSVRSTPPSPRRNFGEAPRSGRTARPPEPRTPPYTPGLLQEPSPRSHSPRSFTKAGAPYRDMWLRTRST